MGRLSYEPPPVHPEALYPATLAAIEEKSGGIDDKGYLTWIFTARDRKGRTITFKENSSHNFGPGSKPRKWAQTLLGRLLTKEEARAGIDFKELVGCECLLDVVIVEKEGELYNRIDKLKAPITDDEEETGEAPTEATTPSLRDRLAS